MILLYVDFISLGGMYKMCIIRFYIKYVINEEESEEVFEYLICTGLPGEM